MRHVIVLIICLFILLTTAISAQVGNNPELVNPNLADAASLQSLPHVTEPLAQAIIYAQPFTSASQLDELLSGTLNTAQRSELYGRLFRPLNLNKSNRGEIMLIPDISERMAHEFEEYRPYASMEQFRREIGKYVDDAELARLEQYVFVPMNLNTAPEEDFKTIPGISNKMVHEFEEYRPYSSMDQFRREMSKYVDEAEVARLESYVTLD